MPPSKLPLEIEETILNFLAGDNKGHSALKVCSPVCQAFLHICRKHIFGNIVLDGNGRYSLRHAFECLLRETPEIADYIRKLDFGIRDEDLTNPSIQESLKRISKVEFLTVRPHCWNFEWNNNPIRPALLHLLHLPTLTHFTMVGINHFVVSDLIHCINLKYLKISDRTTVADETTFPAVFSEHSIQLNEFVVGKGDVAPIIMKLCTARRPDGQPIINFESLPKITVIFHHGSHGDLNDETLRACVELFRHCPFLTNVHINFYFSQHIWPRLADMLRPSMQTLKHIVVNIHYYDGYDPLFGILCMLEGMRTKNVIETVTIGILHNMHPNRRLKDDWSRLDEVLTSTGWFSLERVSLTIDVADFKGSENELKVALKNHETHFSRILSNELFSFDMKVIHRSYFKL